MIMGDRQAVTPKALMDAVVTNAVIGKPFPRTIALYTKLLAKKEEGSSSAPLIGILSNRRVTSATLALACCVAHPELLRIWLPLMQSCRLLRLY
jgi:hypothetical protein